MKFQQAWRVLLTVFFLVFSISFFLFAPAFYVMLVVSIITGVGGSMALARKETKFGFAVLIFCGISTWMFFRSIGMITISPLLEIDPFFIMENVARGTAAGMFVEWLIPLAIAMILVGVAFCWSLIVGVQNVFNWGRSVAYMMLGFICILMFLEITTYPFASTYNAIVFIGFGLVGGIPFEVYYLAEFWSWLFSGYTAVVAVMSHFVSTRSEAL